MKWVEISRFAGQTAEEERAMAVFLLTEGGAPFTMRDGKRVLSRGVLTTTENELGSTTLYVWYTIEEWIRTVGRAVYIDPKETLSENSQPTERFEGSRRKGDLLRLQRGEGCETVWPSRAADISSASMPTLQRDRDGSGS